MSGTFDVSNQGPANMFGFQLPADRIVVMNAPGASPTIDWTGVVTQPGERFLDGWNDAVSGSIRGINFANWSGVDAFLYNSAGDSLVVEGCTFTNISPMGANAVIRFDGVRGAKISNCSFVGRSAGSWSYAVYLRGSELIVEGCTFNSEADLADTLGWSAGVVAIQVEGLVIRDCVGFNAGNDQDMDGHASHFVALFDADDVLIEELEFKRYLFGKNQGSFVHNANGIEIASWDGDASENVEIRSCGFWGAGHGIEVGNASSEVHISYVWCDSTYDDCVFFDDQSSSSSARYVVSNHSQDNGLDFQGSEISVQHCTLIRPKNFALKVTRFATDLSIRDVLVYDVRDPVTWNDAIVRVEDGATNWSFDNDLYFDPDGGQTIFRVGQQSLTFAEWQSAGNDASGMWDDPELCDPNARAWPIFDDGFRLGAGSPAVGAASDGSYVGALGAGCGLVAVADAPSVPQRAKLVPNPTRGNPLVLFDEVVKGARVTIFDATGRLVRRWATDVPGRHVSLYPDRSDRMAPGVYFVHVETEGWEQRLRLVALD